MNTVFQLTIEQIRTDWPELKDFVFEGLRQSKCDDYDIDDVYAQLISSNWALYGITKNDVYKGALVINFIYYPKDVVAYICSIGGEGVMEDTLVDDFVKQLKDKGVARLQGACRPSVVRLWRQIGMYEKYAIVEKKL